MNTAESLIRLERAAIPKEAEWLFDSAQAIADRAAKGTLGMSLVNDVITQAERIRERLTAIATLEKTL